MLWIVGATAVDFNEHDQTGVARRCRRIFSGTHGVGRPSACDPALPTTSITHMRPSGWINA
jgi:hypothetical protein